MDTLSFNILLFGKVVIGTVTGGTKGAPLVVRLNGVATQNSVQALLRSVGFKAVDKFIGLRDVKFQITNLGGTNTNQATRQIQIQP